MYDTLEDIRADIDRRLIRAAKDRKSPMHTPVVGTADADLRVMVLREFDAGKRLLRFHTDLRSPKAQTIGEGAPVGVLFYDKGQKIQVRCKGEGRIEHDTPAVQAAWDAGTNFARRCYLGDGPGALSEMPTSGLPDWAEGIQPTDEQVMPARDNFAILLVEVRSFDWLYLAHTGHMRAQFDDGEGRWVAP